MSNRTTEDSGSRATANQVRSSESHVVALASMASFVSPPGLIPYCNTKAAVLSLHEGLIQEMRTTYQCPEIKFTSVHPTYAATPMTQEWSSLLQSTKATVSVRGSGDALFCTLIATFAGPESSNCRRCSREADSVMQRSSNHPWRGHQFRRYSTCVAALALAGTRPRHGPSAAGRDW